MLFPTRPGAAVLGVTNASISLQESDSDAPDAVQGVALLLRGADAGDLVWERRAHLVVAHTRDHRTLLVETDGSAAAVRTLLRASGVTDAVAFEAGSGALTPHWRGGAEPLRDAYPSTTLFVVGAPMPPGVLRLGRPGSVQNVAAPTGSR
jgi:hypothetical protein